MSYTINNLEDHLVGMGHGGSLAKIRNKYALYERAANNMRSKIDVVNTIKTSALTQAIHDEQFTYSVPSDYGKIIDLYPSGKRTNQDFARRTNGVTASLLKQVKNKVVAVESRDGARVLLIDWAGKSAKTLASLNTVDSWAAVGSAANIALDTLYGISGGKSVKFDVVATGDGLKNTALTALDLSDWDEQADFFAYVYFGDITNLTSITARWGNDVTTAYWESVAQTTQADGTAFQIGWNLLKFSWAAATETGTVDPAAIDSFQIAITAAGAISNVRLDNVTVSLGSIFEMKYYSAYMFKNAAGTWIRQPTIDTDQIMVEDIGFNIFAYECLMAMAQQMEGADSGFDIQFAITALNGQPTSGDSAQRVGLYSRYRKEYPGMSKRTVQNYYKL